MFSCCFRAQVETEYGVHNACQAEIARLTDLNGVLRDKIVQLEIKLGIETAARELSCDRYLAFKNAKEVVDEANKDLRALVDQKAAESASLRARNVALEKEVEALQIKNTTLETQLDVAKTQRDIRQEELVKQHALVDFMGRAHKREIEELKSLIRSP